MKNILQIMSRLRGELDAQSGLGPTLNDAYSATIIVCRLPTSMITLDQRCLERHILRPNKLFTSTDTWQCHYGVFSMARVVFTFRRSSRSAGYPER